ncbi:MAG: hypothetical protein OXO52_06080 [Rhodospirillales bacterium]|nr:hypothetical protein [Rhodospirillales bacterium]
MAGLLRSVAAVCEKGFLFPRSCSRNGEISQLIHTLSTAGARARVPKIVKPAVFDPGFAAHPVPQPEIAVARTRRIARGREHEGAALLRLAFKDTPALRVQRDLPGPGLAFGEHQHVVLDLRPAQADHLAPAASGEQQEPDDVRLLPVAFSILGVEKLVQPAISSRDRKRLSGWRLFLTMP